MIDKLFEGYLYMSDLDDKYAVTEYKTESSRFVIENITESAYNGNCTKRLIIKEGLDNFSINGWKLLGIVLFFSWVDVSVSYLLVQDPYGNVKYINPDFKNSTFQKRSPDALYTVTIGCRISESIPVFQFISSFHSMEELMDKEYLNEHDMGDIKVIGK